MERQCLKRVDTEPKIYHYNYDLSKAWYIGFRKYDPSTNTRKPIQIRLGLNFFNTVASRKKEADSILKLTKDALKIGWNPFIEPLDQFISREVERNIDGEQREQDEIELHNKKTAFIPLMWEVYNIKKNSLSHKSALDIKTVLLFAEKSAKALNITTMPIINIGRGKVKELLTQMGADRQKEYDKLKSGKVFSSHAYNKYKSYLSILFSEIVELEYLEYNPCANIKDRRIIETNIHKLPTSKERDLIVNELKEKHNRFYYFIAIEHATGIRPKEILSLKIKNIDLLNEGLIVEAIETKNKKERFVPLPKYLFNYLLNLIEPFKTNRDYYIFSFDFIPGPERRHRNRVTEYWKIHIKDKLKINVSMYSFKSLGGEEKRSNGVHIDAISKGFGHSSIDMTKIYLPNEQDRLNEQLRNLTPEL